MENIYICIFDVASEEKAIIIYKKHNFKNFEVVKDDYLFSIEMYKTNLEFNKPIC